MAARNIRGYTPRALQSIKDETYQNGFIPISQLHFMDTRQIRCDRKKLIKSFKDLKQKVLNLKERVLQNFQGKLSSYPGGLPLHHLERQMDTGRTDHELYLKISLTRNGRLWNSNTNSVFCF